MRGQAARHLFDRRIKNKGGYLLKSLGGYRTLICGIVLLVINDPYTVGQLLSAAPVWLKPMLNLVFTGAGLAFLNEKLNQMKQPS